MKFTYFYLAKFFLRCGYFRGSSRIRDYVSRLIPLKTGRYFHPLGFSWMISSRDALDTYLSSCEAFTTKIVRSRAHKIDTFISVGANRGWYSLIVGERNKKARIISFECNSQMFAELSLNISANKNQAELHKIAIGEKVTSCDLYMPVSGNEGMSTLFPMNKSNQDASIIERVQVTTLDSCLTDELTSIGQLLILMDIEGSEMLALRGASRLLEETSPILILEVNPDMLAEAQTSPIEIFEYLRRFRYEVYWIDERERLFKVQKDNHLPHLSVLPPHSGANYLFVQNGADWIEEFVYS